jgi:hypothetical protein
MTLLEALLTHRATTILRHVVFAFLGFSVALLTAVAPDIAPIPAHIPNAFFAFGAVLASLWAVAHLALAVIHLNEVHVVSAIRADSSTPVA